MFAGASLDENSGAFCELKANFFRLILTKAEILGLILDVMVSTAPKLRINREEKDIEIVKAQFAKLTKDHVEFVLQSMDDTSTKARNIRAVLLTALYNSVNTINSYYGNRYHFHLAEETRREMEETD